MFSRVQAGCVTSYASGARALAESRTPISRVRTGCSSTSASRASSTEWIRTTNIPALNRTPLPDWATVPYRGDWNRTSLISVPNRAGHPMPYSSRIRVRGLEPLHPGWKPGMLAIEHHTRAAESQGIEPCGALPPPALPTRLRTLLLALQAEETGIEPAGP